jgi:beta-glucosidase/6-phospho-beta-glucosidase/beta-galactosidase
LSDSLADGADVRGHLHGSLLHNVEWFSGYAPTFGLVAVDRETSVRTAGPGLAWFGEVARRNGLAWGGTAPGDVRPTAASTTVGRLTSGVARK